MDSSPGSGSSDRAVSSSNASGTISGYRLPSDSYLIQRGCNRNVHDIDEDGNTYDINIGREIQDGDNNNSYITDSDYDVDSKYDVDEDDDIEISIDDNDCPDDAEGNPTTAAVALRRAVELSERGGASGRHACSSSTEIKKTDTVLSLKPEVQSGILKECKIECYEKCETTRDGEKIVDCETNRSEIKDNNYIKRKCLDLSVDRCVSSSQNQTISTDLQDQLKHQHYNMTGGSLGQRTTTTNQQNGGGKSVCPLSVERILEGTKRHLVFPQEQSGAFQSEDRVSQFPDRHPYSTFSSAFTPAMLPNSRLFGGWPSQWPAVSDLRKPHFPFDQIKTQQATSRQQLDLQPMPSFVSWLHPAYWGAMGHDRYLIDSKPSPSFTRSTLKVMDRCPINSRESLLSTNSSISPITARYTSTNSSTTSPSTPHAISLYERSNNSGSPNVPLVQSPVARLSFQLAPRVCGDKSPQIKTHFQLQRHYGSRDDTSSATRRELTTTNELENIERMVLALKRTHRDIL